MGIAVASKYLAVGSIVPYAEAGVGVVATQFFANPKFGPEGLQMLAEGASPRAAVEHLLREDQHRVRRQLLIMNSEGDVAAYTGTACVPFAGERYASACACSGNTLVSEEVLDNSFSVLQLSGENLSTRLVRALAAGQAAGGDKSGQQSASLLVVRPGAGYGGYSD